MSLVCQFAKAKATEDERRRREEEQANETSTAENVLTDLNNSNNSLSSLNAAESGLGAVDFKRVQNAVAAVVPNKRGKYKKYTDQNRYAIGKYASECGSTAAVNKFKKEHPSLNESTAPDMKRRYEDMLKSNKSGISNKKIKNERRGRPLMLEGIEELVQRYLKAIRARGGHVYYILAEATAKALIDNHPELNLSHIDVESTNRARCLFHMNFVRRASTTAKVPISDDLHKEIELTYLNNIVKKIETHSIPSSLVINLDQMPSKFVPGS